MARCKTKIKYNNRCITFTDPAQLATPPIRGEKKKDGRRRNDGRRRGRKGGENAQDCRCCDET